MNKISSEAKDVKIKIISFVSKSIPLNSLEKSSTFKIHFRCIYIIYKNWSSNRPHSKS